MCVCVSECMNEWREREGGGKKTERNREKVHNEVENQKRERDRGLL